jgi:hypothetical protein
MLRKTLIALTAVAALGAVAIAPTPASAGGGKFGGGKFGGGGFGHHRHFHGGFGIRASGADNCWRPVLTRWGTVKYVYVCGIY